MIGEALHDRGEIEIAVGDVDGEDPVRGEMSEVRLEGFAGEEMDRDRVAREGIEGEEIEGLRSSGRDLALHGEPRVPHHGLHRRRAVVEIAEAIPGEVTDGRIDLIDAERIPFPGVGRERPHAEPHQADGMGLEPPVPRAKTRHGASHPAGGGVVGRRDPCPRRIGELEAVGRRPVDEEPVAFAGLGHGGLDHLERAVEVAAADDRSIGRVAGEEEKGRSGSPGKEHEESPCCRSPRGGERSPPRIAEAGHKEDRETGHPRRGRGEEPGRFNSDRAAMIAEAPQDGHGRDADERSQGRGQRDRPTAVSERQGPERHKEHPQPDRQLVVVVEQARGDDRHSQSTDRPPGGDGKEIAGETAGRGPEPVELAVANHAGRKQRPQMSGHLQLERSGVARFKELPGDDDAEGGQGRERPPHIPGGVIERDDERHQIDAQR